LEGGVGDAGPCHTDGAVILVHLTSSFLLPLQAQLMDAQLYYEMKDWEQVVAVTGKLLKSEPGNLQVRGDPGRHY
jgi:hypothetical protein